MRGTFAKMRAWRAEARRSCAKSLAGPTEPDYDLLPRMSEQHRSCVFCGMQPDSKTREHVLPRWLIEITGEPNRRAYLGRDWTDGTLKERRYSWSAFDPVFQALLPRRGPVLLQPIANPDLREQDPDRFEELYFTDHVRSACREPNRAVGFVHAMTKGVTRRYPVAARRDWKPAKECASQPSMHDLGLWLARRQRELYLDMPDFSHFAQEDRATHGEEIQGVVRIHDQIYRHASSRLP